ncbi:MAG TPA: mechanosensitive ion channel domain-containing protein, partial [Chitinophagales bacterium]|nr:mechanosensitive ion channel domain-containing protein [Chitinophagales bacterium]
MQDFLDIVIWNNTIEQYLWVIGILLFISIFNKYISKFISRLLFKVVRRTHFKEQGEDFLKKILKPIQYIIVLQALFIGLSTLHKPDFFEKTFIYISYELFVLSLYRLLAILTTTWLISRIGDFFTDLLKQKAAFTTDTTDDQLASFLRDVFHVIIWSIGIFTILAVVFHINITSLVAGAGIAGIAIAFAAQETLQNLFGSIAIFTEKPFVVGDFVEVDGMQGSVEKVGFRSTRIRTMDKIFVTVPNKNIVNNKMSNLALRGSRRIQIIIGLTYSTSSNILHEIINALNRHAESHPKRNDRYIVTFYNFSPSSLDIWYDIMLDFEDWESHMHTRNDLMFDIRKIVNDNGGSFAFPTQTVHVSNNQTSKEENTN